MKKKRKDSKKIGMILHKVKDVAMLQPWAQHLAADYSEDLMNRWSSGATQWQCYFAVNPKSNEGMSFESQIGLISFVDSGAHSILRERMPTLSFDGLVDGGLIDIVAPKERPRIVSKYLLSAAERVISDKSTIFYLLVKTSDVSAQKIYRSSGFEELKRVDDQTLFIKNLNS